LGAAIVRSASLAAIMTVQKKTMDFLYDGFEHGANKRRFFFRRTQKAAVSPSAFSINVDMALLARNKVAIQDAPMFCMSVLCAALLSGESVLETYHEYEVRPEDFQGLVAERAKRQTELQMRRNKSKWKAPVVSSSLPAMV
jgi:hypothetical protein